MPIYDCGVPDCDECQKAFGPDRAIAIQNYHARERQYAALEHLNAAGREPWDDGFRGKKLWTYTGGPHPFDLVPHRNDTLWDQIVEVRKILIGRALSWRAAAIADGWTSAPTYLGHEAEETAFRLTRDGFVVQGLARPADKDTVGTGSITCWGPDNLIIPAGEAYDWKALFAATTTCSECKKTGVQTFRAAFVNRGCAECLPAMKRALETPGWNS